MNNGLKNMPGLLLPGDIALLSLRGKGCGTLASDVEQTKKEIFITVFSFSALFTNKGKVEILSRTCASHL